MKRNSGYSLGIVDSFVQTREKFVNLCKVTAARIYLFSYKKMLHNNDLKFCKNKWLFARHNSNPAFSIRMFYIEKKIGKIQNDIGLRVLNAK